MPATATYSPTGNVYVDGVLSGVKWAVSSLTFSFPTDPSLYGSNYGSGEPNNNFKAFTAVQQGAARLILQMYSSVVNVTFTEVTETSSQHGDLRLAESDSPGTAWAYYPSTSAAGGDAWFNNSAHYYDNPVKGSYGWLTMIHELGHAMGLKHPHETSGAFGTVPVDHDSLEYTVMSYRSYVGAPLNGYLTNEFWSYPQSLMMLDIAALQAEYGANFATNGGNTVYSWDPNSGQMFINGAGQGAPGANRIFLTVWDGGGQDTYDFSNYSTNLNVNLQPGAWTTTSSAQLANLGDGHIAAGNIANALLYQGNPASLIENAIGGSGNDMIVGNAANNKLTGGHGNDTLDGSTGTDTAVYSGNSSDYSVLHNANGSWTVADLRAGSPDGTDTLRNIEYLQFGDTTVALGGDPSNNSAPEAVDNYYATPKKHQLVMQGGDLLANDTDPNGNPLYALLVSGPTNGSVSLNTDGSFVYTPSKKFSGIDYFTYKVTDGFAESDVATAWINVGQSNGAAPPLYNTPPVATSDLYSSALAKKLIIGAGALLANDTDADGNALSAVLVAKPMYGKLKFYDDGSFIYTPTKAFHGFDSFGYKVSDGWSLSDAATVTISNSPPVAGNDSYVTDLNTKLIMPGFAGLLTNDTDVNGDMLTAKLVAKPSHGKVSVKKDGSFVYTPSKNFVGVDSFSYKVRDGWSDSNVATVTINVGQNGEATATQNGADKIDLSDDQILPPRPVKTVSSTHSGPDLNFVLDASDHLIHNHGFAELASAEPSSWSSGVQDFSHLQIPHDAHLLLK
jgi:Ca2+-binding RTX toxin-like protein